MGDEFSVEDVMIILRRRIFYFLIPMLVTLIAGLVVVLALPAKYEARGTILVESQQIPTDFIQSTVTAYAQERIQTIRQRVLTRNTLLDIAKQFSIFPSNSSLSESERVEIMRERFSVDLITATGRQRKNTDGTIAFDVSYTDVDPNTAYLTANELMTRFLDEDVRTRTAGASNTTEVFEITTKILQDSIRQVERAILSYKSENSNSLPEHLSLHMTMLERVTQELNNNQSTIFQLDEEKQFLQAQLVSGNRGEGSAAAELARLESELSRLRANYYDSYPAVKEKRDEIASYKRQLAPSREIQALREALSDAEDELIALERANEPVPADIETAEAIVEKARIALSDRISSESRRGASDASGAQLDGRIAVIETRIRMAERRSATLQKEIEDFQSRIGETPETERGLAILVRDQENLTGEYDQLRAKRQAAQLAENLEQNQQAEKFSILESATLPEEPSSPNRAKLAVMVLFAAFGLGGGIALAVEMALQTIRGSNHLTSIIEDHPIAIIPYIANEEDNRRFRRLKLFGKPKALNTAVQGT